MEKAGAGSENIEWFAAANVPRHATWDRRGDTALASVLPGTSPFGGGFHGWRYGVTGFRDDEPFDSSFFYKKPSPPEGTDEEKLNEGLDRLEDEESDERKIARLYAPLLPRRLGTHLGASLGLKPNTPAFVSADGNTFITPTTAHGARKGGFAHGSQGGGSVASALDMSQVMRSSLGHTVSGGLSLSVVSATLSGGVTHQKLDVMDMNGDGIIDVVTPGTSRLTHLRTLGLRAQVPVPDGEALRNNVELSASVGLGISDAIRKLTPGGQTRGMAGMFPGIGGGIGVNLSATGNDLVDVNGDGLPDQVSRAGDAFRVRLNLGTSFAAEEDDLVVGYWGETGVFDPFVKDVQDSGVLGGSSEDRAKTGESREKMKGAVQFLGSADVLNRSTSVTLEGNAGVMLNESFGVSANWETSLGATGVALVDVTGDGLPDYVRKSSRDGQLRVKVNRGYGFESQERRWNLPAWPAETDPAFMLPSPFDKVPGSSSVTGLLSKVLGPYKADAVEATGTHSALPGVGFVVTVPIPLSPFMTPWLHLSGGADVSPKKVSGFELGFADLNGDGLADHVLKTQQGDSSAARSEAVYARVNELGGGNLLKQVKRPLHGTLSLEYVLTDNTVDLPEARYALSKVTLHDGRGVDTGHVLSTRYEYEGGRYERDEKEFLGFRTVRELRADGSQRTLTFRNDTYEYRGLLEREEFRDAGGKLYTAMVNTYGTPELNPGAVQPGCQAYTPFYLAPERYCGSVFIPLKRTERRFYEGATADVASPGLVSARQFQYDAFGNVRVFEELADPLDPSDDLHATVTYLDSPAARNLYLRDRAETVLVRAGRVSSPGALLRKRVAGYDGRGNLTQLTSSIDGSRSATSDLEWYDNGTLLRVTGPRNKTGQRYAITYQYDAVTRTFLTHTQDSFGYESSGVPDLRFGGYVSNTDLNGNVVKREVDAFGRLTGVKGPYEADTGAWATRIEYQHGASPARALTRNFMVDGRGGIGPVSTVVVQDGLGRVIQTKRTVEVFGRGVGMSVSGAVEFDTLGRLVKQGQASFSSAVDTSFVSVPMVHPTRYAYDVLGRVVREHEPDGSLTQLTFDLAVPEGFGFKKFRKRTVDAESNVRAAYTDVLGQQVAEEEHLDGRVLTTRYHFNPSGDLERIVDALGNTTAFTYDLLGRRLTQLMPDTGLTELDYDAAGNIIRKVTPNLRAAHTAIEYDYEYNRLARVDHPFTADIVYTYGGPSAGNNGRNRVIHVRDEAGTEELAYGRLGEVIRSKRVVNPLKPGDRPRTLETRFTFDTFGRMTEMVYPDGERLHYEFDAGGLLARAVGHRPGEDEVYLKRIGYTLFGQKAHVEFGNGVVSHYQYDPVTQQLSFARTQKPGRTLQALVYQYDKVGNVVSLDNFIGPPKGDESGETRYVFKYDDLYRLVEARGTALARTHRVDRFFASWEYSDIHNMTRSVLKRELVRAISTTPEFDHPLREDRDEHYVYDPGHPHRATKIGDTTFMYDANGNTLAECRAFPGEVCDATVPPSNGGEGDVSRRSLKRYQWTEENWLSAVVENGQNATRFVYDSGGNRIAKLGRGGPSVTVGQFFSVKGRGHATKHIFAGSERVATKLLSVPDGFVGLENVPGEPPGSPDPHGCVPSQYEPNKCEGLGTADPVVIDGPQKLKPATFYYHPNHLGSTQWVTDAEAKVHEHVEYYPYGEVWRSPRSDSDGSPTHHQAFLFTSKEFDEETGLSYFGARYYDARHARWLSPDPAWSIQGPPGLNVYQYVAWNPTNQVDPNGQWLESAWDVASFSMGVYSISQWDKNTSTWSKVLDVGGLVVDGAAIILPVVPGGAGAALKVARAGSKVDDVVDVARGTEKGVEAASHFHQAEKATEAVQATEKATEAVKQVEQVAEAANGTKKAEAVGNATKSATDKRVKLRKDTRKEIEARQPRNDKGEMIDPNTQQPLKPGEIDVGHKPGQEWRKRKKMHEEKGSTRKDVIEAENDPDLYQLEDRSSNRSHKHEQKD